MGSSSSKSKSSPVNLDSAAAASSSLQAPTATSRSAATAEFDAPPDLQFDSPSEYNFASAPAAGEGRVGTPSHAQSSAVGAAHRPQDRESEEDEQEGQARVAFGALQVLIASDCAILYPLPRCCTVMSQHSASALQLLPLTCASSIRFKKI